MSKEPSAEEILKNDGFVILLNHLFLEQIKENDEEKRFDMHRDEWDLILKGLAEYATRRVKEANRKQRDLCAKQVPKGFISITFNLPDKIRNAPEPL